MSASGITPEQWEELVEEIGADRIAEFQGLAALSREEFDDALRRCKARGEITTKERILRMARKPTKPKSNLDSILQLVAEQGFEVTLDEPSLNRIAAASFRGKNLALAIVATDIALQEHPLTLRGLFYRVVSAGFLPSTDKQHYSRLGRVMTTLREKRVVPFHWLVDNIRSSLKPSSWADINDYVETIQDAYRKDFWAQLPNYVHVIVEKDAMAGVVEPVTDKYDVTLSPIRGYASLSFANEIAATWKRVQKPIYCFYLGDFDPSGFDLERDIRQKLRNYCQKPFLWRRLGVNAPDFYEFNLLKLDPKKSDKRYQKFVDEHGTACAELDAIPATEIRRRVQTAIETYIPADQWEKLQEIEITERSLFNETLGRLRSGGTD